MIDVRQIFKNVLLETDAGLDHNRGPAQSFERITALEGYGETLEDLYRFMVGLIVQLPPAGLPSAAKHVLTMAVALGYSIGATNDDAPRVIYVPDALAAGDFLGDSFHRTLDRALEKENDDNREIG